MFPGQPSPTDGDRLETDEKRRKTTREPDGWGRGQSVETPRFPQAFPGTKTDGKGQVSFQLKIFHNRSYSFCFIHPFSFLAYYVVVTAYSFVGGVFMNDEMLYQMFANTLGKMDEKELNASLEKAKGLLSANDFEKLKEFIQKEKEK